MDNIFTELQDLKSDRENIHRTSFLNLSYQKGTGQANNDTYAIERTKVVVSRTRERRGRVG